VAVKFNIVLVEPEIPQNTGNIGRICVSTECRLHLIKPYGFILDDKHLRRAGMDYWQHLDVTEYENWDDFLNRNPEAEMVFFSTKGDRSYWDVEYHDNLYLVYGSESKGLPVEFYDRYAEQLCTIPMHGTHSRSLNLANSVALGIYEGLRQAEMKK
jgi:tRNA (cytidine/uridine-2'-O-)-methyltransferase